MKACQRDYYYDGDTRDCRSCAHLCHQAEVQGRLKKCQDLCPVEDANEKAVTVTENLKSSSATLVSPDGITVQDDGNRDKHPEDQSDMTTETYKRPKMTQKRP
ncbi:uncharacterized protein LOC124259300 isoform X3 [Haliotis rubra]|uniref:uncharacterized protein LOC124259300 isoform X3 n=1 Tax=Haliotis rubra TaxID=36100 RepID=UPI001EE58336|nr:uncharacterized protein LOC124259300 isoform X3 [Haliotis rubra]